MVYAAQMLDPSLYGCSVPDSVYATCAQQTNPWCAPFRPLGEARHLTSVSLTTLFRRQNPSFNIPRLPRALADDELLYAFLTLLWEETYLDLERVALDQLRRHVCTTARPYFATTCALLHHETDVDRGLTPRRGLTPSLIAALEADVVQLPARLRPERREVLEFAMQILRAPSLSALVTELRHTESLMRNRPDSSGSAASFSTIRRLLELADFCALTNTPIDARLVAWVLRGSVLASRIDSHILRLVSNLRDQVSALQAASADPTTLLATRIALAQSILELWATLDANDVVCAASTRPGESPSHSIRDDRANHPDIAQQSQESAPRDPNGRGAGENRPGIAQESQDLTVAELARTTSYALESLVERNHGAFFARLLPIIEACAGRTFDRLKPLFDFAAAFLGANDTDTRLAVMRRLAPSFSGWRDQSYQHAISLRILAGATTGVEFSRSTVLVTSPVLAPSVGLTWPLERPTAVTLGYVGFDVYAVDLASLLLITHRRLDRGGSDEQPQFDLLRLLTVGVAWRVQAFGPLSFGLQASWRPFAYRLSGEGRGDYRGAGQVGVQLAVDWVWARLISW